jgi:hypothetical protein
MRRRTLLATIGSGAVLGSGCLGDSNSAGLPRLDVDGPWLVTPGGDRVVLRGVNLVDPWWAGENRDLRGQRYEETLALATNADEGWYPRVLRIPVEPRAVQAVGLETLISDYLDPVVEFARKAGVYLILDYHAIERYDTDAIDRRIRDFWLTVAPEYADQSHVLYELFNEPTRPFGDGLDSWRAWRRRAQPWVDLVREAAPETPLIIGSPRWSSLTRFAEPAPFDGERLIYAAHIYPAAGPDDWAPEYGPVLGERPTIISEWGYVGVESSRSDPHMIGTTEGWGRPFREWLGDYPSVNWSAWCFDSVWMPRMFTADWTLRSGNDYMGDFTKSWLADTKNDHWPISK